jgi:putative oxygen-independent coproporphyrinogen III oxidase
MAGIYVHFPFCSSKCIYCDFYSRVRKDWKPYVDALVKEVSDRKEYLKGVSPSTLYFGGGTPSILPEAQLHRVVEALRRNFRIPASEMDDNYEFTVEVNPDDVTTQKAMALRDMGVNRVSMGVQTFDEGQLRWMKRRHNSEEAVKAFEILRSAGFDNISIDLIFGFSGLSDEQWDYNISRSLELHPEHISCYQMMGRWSDKSQERCFAQYMSLQERLAAAGYHQYEISNYSLPGFESRHNSAYWVREPYLGLGAGAHSFDGGRRRSWNLPDIDSYISSRPFGSESLSDEEVFEEQVMLGLRRCAGLDVSTLKSEFAVKIIPVLEQMSKTGDVVFDGRLAKIPSEKLFISDSLVSRLVSI